MLEVSSSKPLASESRGFSFWVELIAPGLPSAGYLSYVHFNTLSILLQPELSSTSHPASSTLWKFLKELSSSITACTQKRVSRLVDQKSWAGSEFESQEWSGQYPKVQFE
ncbi:hypothetical protein H5410_051327 [Solanum commersonii]|uniref:Uncharacterized protein n=1 Tax=Solanum commersonii TaxID=4109 RepID=A0A9J5X078_SOLCO|nr:hypothetical protein H5410_051327 [Solanum commersonii]